MQQYKKCLAYFSASDDTDKWYHYGLIGGASLALIVALAAVCCWCNQHSELEEVRKKLSSAQKQNAARSPPKTDSGYSNNAYSNADEVEEYKRQGISNGNNSPFNKRNRQVTPNLKRAWGIEIADANKAW